MGNSESDSGTGIPAWQKAQSTTTETSSENGQRADATIEQARKFLQDGEVQKATRERKTEFLRGKGIDQAVITQLLDEGDKELDTKVCDYESSCPFARCADRHYRKLLRISQRITLRKTLHRPLHRL